MPKINKIFKILIKFNSFLIKSTKLNKKSKKWKTNINSKNKKLIKYNKNSKNQRVLEIFLIIQAKNNSIITTNILVQFLIFFF